MMNLLTPQSPGTHRLLCLLLCVCAWRGPVPVVHQHVALRADAANLARHLQSFHQCAADCTDSDWHWHLALPNQPAEHDGEPSWPDVPAELTAAFAVVAAQSCGGSTMPTSVVVDQFSCSTTAVIANSRQRSRPPDGVAASFLQSFARSVPTCALTGVALR